MIKRYLCITALITILCSCASNQIFYLDKKHYSHFQEQKKLYLFPISSIKFDDTATAYIQYFLKKSPSASADTMLKYLNYQYVYLAKKYIEKEKAVVSDSAFSKQLPAIESTQGKSTKIFNNNKSRFIEIIVPEKNIIDSLNLNCNYYYFISDLIISHTIYQHDMFIPTPIGFVAGHESAPAFLIKGKYVCWDIDNDRMICAGEINTLIFDLDIDKSDIKYTLHDVLAEILDQAPFWSVQRQEERDRNKRELQRQGY